MINWLRGADQLADRVLEFYSVVLMYHSLFIQLSIKGHFDCLQFVCVCVCVCVCERDREREREIV